jgi:hypothetical protein
MKTSLLNTALMTASMLFSGVANGQNVDQMHVDLREIAIGDNIVHIPFAEGGEFYRIVPSEKYIVQAGDMSVDQAYSYGLVPSSVAGFLSTELPIMQNIADSNMGLVLKHKFGDKSYHSYDVRFDFAGAVMDLSCGLDCNTQVRIDYGSQIEEIGDFDDLAMEAMLNVVEGLRGLAEEAIAIQSVVISLQTSP